jgi:hypothetical protein
MPPAGTDSLRPGPASSKTGTYRKDGREADDRSERRIREGDSAPQSGRQLLKGRTQVAEKLAGQLDTWEQAKAAVNAAQTKADLEAAPHAPSTRRRSTPDGPRANSPSSDSTRAAQ